MLFSRTLPSIRCVHSRLATTSHRLMSQSAVARSDNNVPLLVTPKELRHLLDSDTPPVVLDSTWFMPNIQPPRDPFAEFKQRRILGSAFWNVDIIATKAKEGLQLPHMMPSPEHFADAASRLGIDRDARIVVYDTVGVFSSPRTAFTFKAFGHHNVSVLDGGLPRWEAEGHYIDTTFPSHINPHSTDEPKQTSYGPIMSELLYAKKPRVESYFIADIEDHFSEYPVPQLDEAFIRSYEQMVANAERDLDQTEAEIVLDARPAGRFHGQDPEPRQGLSSGHIPHSISLPFSNLLSAKSTTTPAYQTLLAPAALEQKLIEALGEERWNQVKSGEKRVATTCGSGMTAAVLWLALSRLGVKSKPGLYDESWTGYASRSESKIEKS